MGVSSDGILVFGFDLGDGSDLLNQDGNEEFDSVPDWFEHKTKDVDRHERPVDLTWHCSYDYPMYILSIPGTQVTAWRGSPTVIEPGTLLVSEDAIEKARLFCVENGIEWKTPSWILCSMYG